MTWTPWSVVGALAALALIVLLAAREVRPGRGAAERAATAVAAEQFWFSLPLLVVFLASLVQRFLTMK